MDRQHVQKSSIVKILTSPLTRFVCSCRLNKYWWHKQNNYTLTLHPYFHFTLMPSSIWDCQKKVCAIWNIKNLLVFNISFKLLNESQVILSMFITFLPFSPYLFPLNEKISGGATSAILVRSLLSMSFGLKCD